MIPEDNSKTEVMQPTAIEAISRAEIDVAIATARRFPRQLHSVKQSMMSFATLDEDTAASCFYTLPRGGKNIQGPSVRLAEIAVSCYGNLRAGTRIVQSVADGPSPHVVIQAVAMDLERNISVTIEKRRRIVGKKSKGGHIDEDDINLAANAGSAIAFRDAVFKVIPLALIKPVFEAARKVAIGDARTLADRRARSIDTFGKMGIPKERLLAKLEKKAVEDIGLEDIETLIGLHNAIKEGELTIEEAFPPIVKQAAGDPGQPKQPTAPATAPAASQTRTTTEPAKPQTSATAPQQQAAPTAPVNNPQSQEPTAPWPENAQPGTAAPATPPTAAITPPITPATPPTADSGEEHKMAMESLSLLMEQKQVTLNQVVSWAKKNRIARDGQKISELAVHKIKRICKIIEDGGPIFEEIVAQAK